MIDQVLSTLWTEALAAQDRDAYVSELALSSIFPSDTDPAVNAEYVGKVWDVAHMSAQEIVTARGLKRTACAQLLCMPYRTLESWCRGDRDCGDYIRLWLAVLLGIIK